MTFDPTKPTPVAIHNRPGLSAIRRRIGTHSRFKEAMIRGLANANRPGLAELKTREDGDFTVALIDAWAAVCGSLTFYVERSANEAYLRTATERISLRRLGRLIGYELAPAKAASVFLLFEADPADPPEVTLAYEPPLGVRSIPGPGQLPQYFETIEKLTAHPNWNAIRPRLTRIQTLDNSTQQVQLTPEAPRVRVGDPVVFMRDSGPVASDADQGLRLIRSVSNMAEGIGRRVVVSLNVDPVSPPSYVYFAPPLAALWPAQQPLTTTALVASVMAKSWSIGRIATTVSRTRRSVRTLAKAIAKLKTVSSTEPIQLYAMRVKAACFGHNAVTKRTTPVTDASDNVVGKTYTIPSTPGSITQSLRNVEVVPDGKAYIYLDREYEEIVSDSVVVLRQKDLEVWVRVEAVDSISVDDYGMSAKVTRLMVPVQGTLPGGGRRHLSAFNVRRTTVYGAPERLPLADLPIVEPVGQASVALGADEVELDREYLTLLPGKKVAITGELAELAGVFETEVKEIADNVLSDARTVLRFRSEFRHRYVRDTVVLNANVAEATHGESAEEILGDGDSTKPFQSFTLKGAPLTHVSARTDTGMAPAIEVWVNGVRWNRVDDFRESGPEDHVYIVRMDENGAATVTFGDGGRGSRLPTGQVNVVATYRKGAGLDGMLDAGQLSLLAAKPVGLKAVSNAMPPAGGAPAEALQDARVNAPLQVLTLGRIVSLRDYEDFARGFAAVAKARADWAWDGYSRPVYLTVAGTGGVELPETGADMTNLVAALEAASEADAKVFVRNHRPAFFQLKARLFIEEAYVAEAVLAAAESALRAAFSFEARSLGQGVSAANVIAVLQAVAGVRGVDLDQLYRRDQPSGLNAILPAAVARPGQRGVPEPAELLLLWDEPAELEVA